MRTEPRRVSRVHYTAPVPRGYSALLALRIAHAAVLREDMGDAPGAEHMGRHARCHMLAAMSPEARRAMLGGG